MNQADIDEAKRLAQKAVDGFVTPKLRQARDVLRLAKALEEAQRQPKMGGADDFLKGIFGNR